MKETMLALLNARKRKVEDTNDDKMSEAGSEVPTEPAPESGEKSRISASAKLASLVATLPVPNPPGTLNVGAAWGGLGVHDICKLIKLRVVI